VGPAVFFDFALASAKQKRAQKPNEKRAQKRKEKRAQKVKAPSAKENRTNSHFSFSLPCAALETPRICVQWVRVRVLVWGVCVQVGWMCVCTGLQAVLWSQNFLFPLRLRLSKSFSSGSSSSSRSGAGSNISFVTSFNHRFHIKK
jgi:hypothetical protein